MNERLCTYTIEYEKTLKNHANTIYYNVDEYIAVQNCNNCNEKYKCKWKSLCIL